MKRNQKNIIIAITVIIILILIVGAVLINNTGILEKIEKNKEKILEAEATSKLEQALEIAKTKKENDIENYNNEEYLNNLLKEQNISIHENIAYVNEYSFEIDRENLNIIQALGKTTVSIETKVLKLLGENEQGKERGKIQITVSSNTPIENIILENENGTYSKENVTELTYTKELELQLDKNYVITVVTKDGKIISKVFKSTKEDYVPPKIESPSI